MARHLCEQVPDTQAAGLPAPDDLTTLILDVTTQATLRDLEGGAKAVTNLLPTLAHPLHPHSLQLAERLVLMIVGASDMADFSSLAKSACEALKEKYARKGAGGSDSLHQQLLLHDKGGLLDAAAGEADADALADEENRDHDRDLLRSLSASTLTPLLQLKALSNGERAMAEAAAAAEALLLPSGSDPAHPRPQAPVLLQLTLPRRIGPQRGLLQGIKEKDRVVLCKALHMVAAIRHKFSNVPHTVSFE